MGKAAEVPASKAGADASSLRIAAMATRLAHLHAADEATIWTAIPAAFSEVMGEPCDQEDAYHIAIAGAVAAEVRRSKWE